MSEENDFSEHDFETHMEFPIGAIRDEGNEKLAKHLEHIVKLAIQFRNGKAKSAELYKLWYSMPTRTSGYQTYATEHSRRVINKFTGL